MVQTIQASEQDQQDGKQRRLLRTAERALVIVRRILPRLRAVPQRLLRHRRPENLRIRAEDLVHLRTIMASV